MTDNFDFDADLVMQAAEEAPEAGYSNVNFGRVSIQPSIVSWVGTGVTNDETGKEVREIAKRPLRKGDKADPKKGEYIQLKFIVNISELNPALTFEYERDVDMKVNGPRTLTNWSEIVLPSLLEVFGEEWSKALAKQPYVAVEDVADCNGARSKKKGTPLTTIKFIATYKNKAECLKARDAKFAKSNGAATDEIPVKLINSAKGLLKSTGSVEAAIALIEDPDNGLGEMYSGVDLKKLFAKAAA